MNRSVFWALVRKDLYLLRGFIFAAVGTGVLAVLLAMFGGSKGFAIGGVLYLTANVASGIFIAMYALLTERKEQTRLFALSLPISGAGYERAKLMGGYAAYLIPWSLLTAMGLGLFLLPAGAPHGMAVYTLVLQGFSLALFSVVLAGLFVVTSELMAGVLILCVNILFSLFMVTLNQPEMAGPLRSPQLNWTPFALGMLACELLAIVLATAFVLVATARRRDHI